MDATNDSISNPRPVACSSLMPEALILEAIQLCAALTVCGMGFEGIRGEAWGVCVQVVVRDIYKERDIGRFTGTFTDIIEAHGVLALRLTPVRWVLYSITCIAILVIMLPAQV